MATTYACFAACNVVNITTEIRACSPRESLCLSTYLTILMSLRWTNVAPVLPTTRHGQRGLKFGLWCERCQKRPERANQPQSEQHTHDYNTRKIALPSSWTRTSRCNEHNEQVQRECSAEHLEENQHRIGSLRLPQRLRG